MRVNFVHVFAVALTVSISLEIAGLAEKRWGRISGEDYGLLTCFSCKGTKSGWTWECMARSQQYFFENASGIYYDGYKAGAIYMILDIGSIAIGLLLLEKLVFIIFNRKYGHKSIVVALVLVHYILHLTAMILWFALTKSSFENSEIQATTGPAIAISNSIWLTIFFPIFLYNFSAFDSISEEDVESIGKMCGVNAKIYNSIGLCLQFIAASLIIAGIRSEKWLEVNGSYGGIRGCAECNEIHWLNWSCLAGIECEMNESSEDCKAYSSISKASQGFVVIQSIGLFFSALVIQPCIALLISRRYGFNFLIQIYSVFAFLLSLTSTIIFSLATNLEFASDCERKTCAHQGFIFNLIGNIILLLSASFFIIGGFKVKYLTYDPVVHLKGLDITGNISINKSQFLKAIGSNIEPEKIEELPTDRKVEIKEAKNLIHED